MWYLLLIPPKSIVYKLRLPIKILVYNYPHLLPCVPYLWWPSLVVVTARAALNPGQKHWEWVYRHVRWTLSSSSLWFSSWSSVKVAINIIFSKISSWALAVAALVVSWFRGLVAGSLVVQLQLQFQCFCSPAVWAFLCTAGAQRWLIKPTAAPTHDL